MREVIKEKIRAIDGNESKYNFLREYLQALVLKFIEQKNYSRNIAFVGGTALRFLYDIARFSEDMDFSLISSEGFSFETFLKELNVYFSSIGIMAEYKPKAARTVLSSFLKFLDVMYENGLTHRKDQKLLIKLEVDSNPPGGYVTEVSFVQKMTPMNVLHYNLPSLFAGKLHAILLRQYTKGRDFYDLMWFLGKGVEPNYVQLQNAIFQTTGNRVELDGAMLKEKLKQRLASVNWKDVVNEVGVFLANRDESKYLTADTFNQLLEKARF